MQCCLCQDCWERTTQRDKETRPFQDQPEWEHRRPTRLLRRAVTCLKEGRTFVRLLFTVTIGFHADTTREYNTMRIVTRLSSKSTTKTLG